MRYNSHNKILAQGNSKSKYKCCGELRTLMILRVNYSLSILSHERKNKNESILKREIRNDIEMGCNVPWHVTSIYRAMHQIALPFETKVFHQAKLMNQSNVSPSKAYESK